MIPSLIFLAVILAAAAVVFEIWVVKKGGKYTGLVLPGLTFLLSFLFLYLFTNGSMLRNKTAASGRPRRYRDRRSSSPACPGRYARSRLFPHRGGKGIHRRRCSRDMDGFEATRAIRASAHPDGKTVPIIALSADAYLADIQKAHDYGMTSHLSKPIDPALLLRTLQRDIQDRPDES